MHFAAISILLASIYALPTPRSKSDPRLASGEDVSGTTSRTFGWSMESPLGSFGSSVTPFGSTASSNGLFGSSQGSIGMLGMNGGMAGPMGGISSSSSLSGSSTTMSSPLGQMSTSAGTGAGLRLD
ncbi:hypothetical protein BCR37DRAFT_62617 [Protomyces lactucae-debilis]|uniref:Uncharacterized protein n=1 Tax=Protomyces lactucae-debilis TaxID=2754530 RepID=A0A1Y2FAT2_PROLT|nr:uncharacterized protein BCR37DRAFT_62617 [Protomyces lactucae-debilis]ORY81020.1 hypothetical protein BCR37DRAFT_62617 [Protomyces lactucae-debilis]